MEYGKSDLDRVTELALQRCKRWDRREFVRGLSAAAGSAVLLGYDMGRVAAEPPPETRKVRLVHAPSICLAPQYLAEKFLRMEGFTEVEYVRDWTTWPAREVNEHRADFSQDAAWTFLPSLDSGGSTVALAGVHAGCYQLFVNERVEGIRDLKGKIVAIPFVGSPDHMLLASVLAHVGINPNKDVKWITGATGTDAITLYLKGKADAYLAFAPQGRELRAKKAGRVILDTTLDRPWSQYYCCIFVGDREYVTKYPIATKRVLRAFLKAADICAQDPERAARMLVDRGFEPRYAVALEVLKELPYQRWRETDPEDTLRFYALRLHEAGMIKSAPSKIIAQGTDWRFLNELKKELKT